MYPKERVLMASGNNEQGHVPSTFFYSFCATDVVVPVLAFLLRIHAKPDKAFRKAEGPIVILGNHPSYLDPIAVMRLTRGRKVNFSAGEFLFRNRIWGYLFRKAGIIEIRQFTKDTSAAMGMMRVLRRNGVLAVFPEATRFVDGKSVGFDDGIAKLIKKTGAGVWFVRSRGLYLTYPRWSTSFVRLGRVEAKFGRSLTKEEVASMSVEELHGIIMEELDYNENDYAREKGIRFRSRRPAAGLQNIAYACPKCGVEFSMRFTGRDEIRCIKCGNRVKMLPTGLLAPGDSNSKTFEDLHRYAEWERSVTREQIKFPGFAMSAEAKLLKKYDAIDFAHVGNGYLTVTAEKIVYEGTDSEPEDGIVYHKGKIKRGFKNRELKGHPIKVEFYISEMKGIVVNYGKYLELHDKTGMLYRFLIDGQLMFKIQQIVAMNGKLKA